MNCLYKYLERKKNIKGFLHQPISTLHCKNSFVINSNYLSLKRRHFTVRNKGDLESFIKTKTSILAL